MKKIISLAAILFLLSCNNSGNKTDKSSANEGSVISVTITGGPNAGIYHVITKEETCSEGLTGENSFANQYSESGKKDNELSNLQLIIDDKNSAKNGTDKFSIQVSFGKLKSYRINTRSSSKEGSGQVTLTESGQTKTAEVEGKTADGIGISATIKCYSMYKAR